MVAIGTVEALFQYRSNTPDRSGTTGPTASTSRSRKLAMVFTP